VLSAFAEAEKLDMLEFYLSGRRSVATDVVRDELRVGASTRPALQAAADAEWLARGALDTDAELLAFARWAALVGSGRRGLGEASVFAYTEIHDAVSITDDRAAVNVARRHGLDVHGTLWLIAGFCEGGKLTDYAAARLIDSLRGVGARMPCTGDEFPAWAGKQGLVPEARRSGDAARDLPVRPNAH
jgi:hypothetical protein